LLLAVLVSTRLRAGGSRHAFGPRQLPSKPCRPLASILSRLYEVLAVPYEFKRKRRVPVVRLPC